MLTAERQLAILNMIRDSGVAEVEILARKLGVSTMTIRRDLKKLQENGSVERCYGGAVSKTEVTYDDKKTVNQEEKERIAECCAGFVREGTTVFLDAGTTTYRIAKRIMEKKDMTIVTNDLEIALLLRNSRCELILCGGNVQKSTLSIFGCYAMEMMKNFRFDTGFFGAAVISPELMVMTPTAEKAFLKRQINTQCVESYLVADHSKFGLKGMNVINLLSDYTGVVTDHVFSEKEKAILKHQGARIIQV